ncbi:MAG: hypothetical protein ABIO38_08065 [Luteimonas sp.]
MSLMRRLLLPLLIVLLAGGATAAGRADGGDDDKDREKKQGSRDDDDSLSDSVRRIERATQGQILSAERVQFDGRDVHRVKVVDDRGRVRIYVDDPEQPLHFDGAKSDDDKPAPRTRRDDNDDPNL